MIAYWLSPEGRRYKKFFITLFVFCLFQSFSLVVCAEQYLAVTSRDLIEKSKYYDQKFVAIKGEAIGDIMVRGEFAWLNIQDVYNVIGIWAPRAYLKDIQTLGDYFHQGDVVKIRGRFVRADPDLAGEFCIKADSVFVLSSGGPLPHKLSENKIKLVKILFAFAVVLLITRMSIKRKTA